MSVTPPTPAPADDETTTGQGSRSGLMVLCAVALLILAVSLVGGNDTSADSSRPPLPAHPGTTASSAPPATGAADSALPRSKPVRLLIPEIAVDAPFTDLAIGDKGQLQPPPAGDTNLVGWYAKGVSPGEKGTSIIAGHVDTKTSAAVFARLDQLDKGDKFQVRRADGRSATFVVDGLETFAKDEFPSDRVYGDADRPEVRLITCAGDYDHKVKDYTDNLVVFAHLA
ncbi:MULTISPECIES: class F sortase [Streptomyces]|uniref:Secreted protein n=5 Tax=Streptomyces TaxID=1883 RepID=A0A7U9DY92_STRLI|nr:MULTISPECIES: class F sortase [Streptomyces]QSJ06943.1 secreted protein [Streptomyces lividans]AIJ11440.1 secreted protein [Streptomyces lividans TK24]EOY52369.1 secreted protein [Streptomyces lividans 1326]KKD14346.1 sortase [Streptomyces sp. WM6391]MDX3315702.1 class F sortase [Streptomyces sp. ME03-5684b]